MRAQAAFTLVELVIVVALVAIVAAIVGYRWRDSGDVTLGYQADRFARDLRHAQILATAQGRVLRVHVETARYCVTLSPDTLCAHALRDPATDAPFVVDLRDGVRLAGHDTDFDAWGRPADAALLATARRFQLTSANASASVVLAPITGLTQVLIP